MTQDELKFDLKVEEVFSKITEPEYRQVLNIITGFSHHSPSLVDVVFTPWHQIYHYGSYNGKTQKILIQNYNIRNSLEHFECDMLFHLDSKAKVIAEFKLLKTTGLVGCY